MATTYDPPKANVTNMIRNSMFRSGVIGQSLQQQYGKIADKEVVDILKSQISELNNNNVTLSSIDNIARRISNNVFALAKLMQKLYELKVREKMLQDRERFRQEASQEESRFEALAEERTETPSRKRRKKEMSSFEKNMLNLGGISILAVGFKNEIKEFLEKTNKWFDETLDEAKNSIETLIEVARKFIGRTFDDYVAESLEEVKLNQEEDVETERIASEIYTELEEEDKRIDSALGLVDYEERVVAETISSKPIIRGIAPIPTANAEAIASQDTTESLSSYVDPGEMVPPAPTKVNEPNILDFIKSDDKPSIETPAPITAPASTVNPTVYSPSTTESDARPGISSSPARSELSRSLTDSIAKPPMLMPSASGALLSSMPPASSGYRQSFGDVMQSMGITPTTLDNPQMSVPTSGLINSSMLDLGSKISETSFGNRMARNYSAQPTRDNTTVISSGNVDAIRPGVDHYVPSPIANRGSLEIGVRFNATA